MNLEKTELENKMNKLYDTIKFYKLYIDILPDDIPVFINEITAELNKLEEEYDNHTHFKAKNKKSKKINISNLGKIKLAKFKEKCSELNLSKSQIDELRQKRRTIKNRMYAQNRRDKLKAKNNE